MTTLKIFLLAAILCIICGVTPCHSQNPEQIYQKALMKEEGEGNLPDAIKFYSLVVDHSDANKSLKAKALLHIGMCYEKLGNQEAVKAYKRLVNNFPGEKQQVAIARERLSQLIQVVQKVDKIVVKPVIPDFKKIQIPTKPSNGILSPDGNDLAFCSNGAVWILPLHGKVSPDIAGEPVQLAEIPGVWDSGSLMAWSADGKWIAVNGEETDDGTLVYVIPVSGSEPHVLNIPKRGGHTWSYRLSLSPDGQMLAFSGLEPGVQEAANPHDRRIYTIPVAGGEVQQRSFDWSLLPSYSPDSAFLTYVSYDEPDESRDDLTKTLHNSDLWVAPLSGETPHKLASTDGRLRGPIWSLDRKYIAVHHEPGGSNDSKEVWIYPLSPDASSVGAPAKISLPGSSFNLLAGWTPKNELGVFIHKEQHDAIYTVPASGGKAVQVSPEGKWPYYPRWSPDGKRIYYRGFDMEKKQIFTYSVSYDGSKPIEVSVQSDRKLVSIVPGGGHNISPNGNKMVISAYQEPYDPKEGGDLWTIPLDGGTPTR
ncbi:MAG: tetratricopeptide repeat protein, partial [Saprospiraceae bacterium]|nr:tetratricopeptide repeat protein [Saprospiraceae bacterium]